MNTKRGCLCIVVRSLQRARGKGGVMLVLGVAASN